MHFEVSVHFPFSQHNASDPRNIKLSPHSIWTISPWWWVLEHGWILGFKSTVQEDISLFFPCVKISVKLQKIIKIYWEYLWCQATHKTWQIASEKACSWLLSDTAPLSISGTYLLFLDNRIDDELVHDYITWWCNINLQHSCCWKTHSLLLFVRLWTSQVNEARKQGLEGFLQPTASKTALTAANTHNELGILLLKPSMRPQSPLTGTVWLDSHWNHTHIAGLQNWYSNALVSS